MGFRFKCPVVQVGEQKVYMCDNIDMYDEDATMNDAMNLMTCDDTLNQALKLDPEHTSMLGIRDAVCYMVGAGAASKVERNYFVCYQRPPRIEYDDIAGADMYVNPGYEDGADPNPDIMRQNLEGACSAFQGATTMIETSRAKTQTNANSVNSAVATLKTTYDTVERLRAQYCGSASNADQVAACAALTRFGSAATDPDYQKLLTIQAALNSAISGMTNYLTTDTVPKFSGLNCKPRTTTT